jgi:hypothetical protein
LDEISYEIESKVFGKFNESHICLYKGELAFVQLSTLAHQALSKNVYTSEHLRTIDGIDWRILLKEVF